MGKFHETGNKDQQNQNSFFEKNYKIPRDIEIVKSLILKYDIKNHKNTSHNALLCFIILFRF